MTNRINLKLLDWFKTFPPFFSFLLLSFFLCFLLDKMKFSQSTQKSVPMYYQEKHPWLRSFSIYLLKTSLPDKFLKDTNHEIKNKHRLINVSNQIYTKKSVTPARGAKVALTTDHKWHYKFVHSHSVLYERCSIVDNSQKDSDTHHCWKTLPTEDKRPYTLTP